MNVKAMGFHRSSGSLGCHVFESRLAVDWCSRRTRLLRWAIRRHYRVEIDAAGSLAHSREPLFRSDSFAFVSGGREPWFRFDLCVLVCPLGRGLCWYNTFSI